MWFFIDVWLSSSSCVINLAIIINWQKTLVFFKNLGGIENSKPFFNKSISLTFNWYFDRFVTTSPGSNGNIVFLVRLRNFFWRVVKRLLSSFLALLWIDLYRRNQVMPLHLDVINWIFFSRSTGKFFCSWHLLCEALFKSRFLMDLMSFLFANYVRQLCKPFSFYQYCNIFKRYVNLEYLQFLLCF